MLKKNFLYFFIKPFFVLKKYIFGKIPKIQNMRC